MNFTMRSAALSFHDGRFFLIATYTPNRKSPFGMEIRSHSSDGMLEAFYQLRTFDLVYERAQSYMKRTLINENAERRNSVTYGEDDTP